MKMILKVTMLAALAAVLLSSTGCYRVKLEERPPMRTYTLDVNESVQTATRAEVDLKVAVGELVLSTDTTGTALLAGKVEYAPDTWKPELKYDVDAEDLGRLIMRQPSTSEVPAFRTSRNAWDLRLGRSVPVDLRLELGVGTSRVDLTGANLTYLAALTGVGETAITLPEPAATGVLACRIEAGLGQVVIRVPDGVAVRITGGKDGIGDFAAPGFTAMGDAWTNKPYDDGSPRRIEIDLRRGVGEFRIETVK